MQIMKTLVPIDLSDCSAWVVRQAAGLMRHHGGQVLLLHIAPIPPRLSARVLINPGAGAESKSVSDYLAAEAAPMMRPYEQICAEEEVVCRSEVISGNPVEQILVRAGDWDADLIVMGSHGRRGLSRVLLGSIAEDVIRRAKAPVMTIRARRTADCSMESCTWCSSGISNAQRQAAVELEG